MTPETAGVLVLLPTDWRERDIVVAQIANRSAQSYRSVANRLTWLAKHGYVAYGCVETWNAGAPRALVIRRVYQKGANGEVR